MAAAAPPLDPRSPRLSSGDTHEPPAGATVGPVRRSYWALIVGAALLWALGMAAIMGFGREPSRIRGQVITIGPTADETRLCLSHPIDAGSHGPSRFSDPACFRGFVHGPTPKVGDCIILRALAESSALIVTPAAGCR